MGGAGTEVSAESRDILLEAAYWTPARVRLTRRALNLSTEASYRFERGVDLWGGEAAMRRCIELVLATAGGELAEPPLDLWPAPSYRAPHLPPARPGGPGAGRRAALGTSSSATSWRSAPRS